MTSVFDRFFKSLTDFSNAIGFSVNVLAVSVTAFTLYVPLFVVGTQAMTSVWVITSFILFCNLVDKLVFARYLYPADSEVLKKKVEDGVVSWAQASQHLQQMSEKEKADLQNQPLAFSEYVFVSCLVLCSAGSSSACFGSKFRAFSQLLIGLCSPTLGVMWSIALASVYFMNIMTVQFISIQQVILTIKCKKQLIAKSKSESAQPLLAKLNVSAKLRLEPKHSDSVAFVGILEELQDENIVKELQDLDAVKELQDENIVKELQDLDAVKELHDVPTLTECETEGNNGHSSPKTQEKRPRNLPFDKLVDHYLHDNENVLKLADQVHSQLASQQHYEFSTQNFLFNLGLWLMLFTLVSLPLALNFWQVSSVTLGLISVGMLWVAYDAVLASWHVKSPEIVQSRVNRGWHVRYHWPMIFASFSVFAVVDHAFTSALYYLAHWPLAGSLMGGAVCAFAILAPGYFSIQFKRLQAYKKGVGADWLQLQSLGQRLLYLVVMFDIVLTVLPVCHTAATSAIIALALISLSQMFEAYLWADMYFNQPTVEQLKLKRVVQVAKQLYATQFQHLQKDLFGALNEASRYQLYRTTAIVLFSNFSRGYGSYKLLVFFASMVLPTHSLYVPIVAGILAVLDTLQYACNAMLSLKHYKHTLLIKQNDMHGYLPSEVFRSIKSKSGLSKTNSIVHPNGRPYKSPVKPKVTVGAGVLAKKKSANKADLKEKLANKADLNDDAEFLKHAADFIIPADLKDGARVLRYEVPSSEHRRSLVPPARYINNRGDTWGYK